jgi:hypothetical protein
VAPTVDGVRDGILRALRRPRPDETDLAQRHSWRRSALRLAQALQPSAAPAIDHAMESHR